MKYFLVKLSPSQFLLVYDTSKLNLKTGRNITADYTNKYPFMTAAYAIDNQFKQLY